LSGASKRLESRKNSASFVVSDSMTFVFRAGGAVARNSRHRSYIVERFSVLMIGSSRDSSR